MEENLNNNPGVCCDVYECVHNEYGCNCKLKTIKISKGCNDNSHYCKTFKSK